MEEKLNYLVQMAQENYFANIFNSAIDGSPWLRERGLCPGRWAVGYPFLYALFRTLNNAKPQSILELGLGQSTKLTAQYVANMGGGP